MHIYKPKGLNRKSKSLKGNRRVRLKKSSSQSLSQDFSRKKISSQKSSSQNASRVYASQRDSRLLGFFSFPIVLVLAAGGLSGLLYEGADSKKKEVLPAKASVVKASFEKSTAARASLSRDVDIGKVYLKARSKDSKSVPSIAKKTQKPKVAGRSRQVVKSKLKSNVRPKLQFLESGLPKLNQSFFSKNQFSHIIQDTAGKKIRLTIDKKLQQAANKLLSRYKVKHGAIVALEPSTGKIKALASRSVAGEQDLPLALRSGFPAASLFKIVTGAAAIEESGLSSRSEIKYRGGDYTLNKGNFKPDAKTDIRKMKLDEAMGRSVNPVFARVALNNLNSDILGDYAQRFGFMGDFTEEFPIEASGFPEIKDDFQLARTAAGFGDVSISPLHAALMSATVANDGVMMKPYLIESVVGKDGEGLYKAQTQAWGRVLLSSTARELNEMMLKTSTSGTWKKQFRRWNKTDLKNIKVSGKTGTLSGKNPQGRYLWFAGSAPADQPDLSIAVMVVDSGGGKIGSSALARLFFEEYFSEKTR